MRYKGLRSRKGNCFSMSKNETSAWIGSLTSKKNVFCIPRSPSFLWVRPVFCQLRPLSELRPGMPQGLCVSQGPGCSARQPFDFSSYVSWDFVVSVVVLLQFVLGQWPLSTVPALEVTSLTFQAEQQIELYKLTPVRDSVILNSSGNHILGCPYLVQELLTCGTLSNHSKEANCIK